MTHLPDSLLLSASQVHYLVQVHALELLMQRHRSAQATAAAAAWVAVAHRSEWCEQATFDQPGLQPQPAAAQAWPPGEQPAPRALALPARAPSTPGLSQQTAPPAQHGAPAHPLPAAPAPHTLNSCALCMGGLCPHTCAQSDTCMVAMSAPLRLCHGGRHAQYPPLSFSSPKRTPVLTAAGEFDDFLLDALHGPDVPLPGSWVATLMSDWLGEAEGQQGAATATDAGPMGLRGLLGP